MLNLGSLILLLSVLLSRSVFGTTLAVGPVAESLPGLSIQYQQTSSSAFHFTGHYSDEGRLMVNLDVQKFHFFVPENLELSETMKTGLYSGIGLRGEVNKISPDRELYSLRIPVGLQANSVNLPLQFFIELTGLIGHIPKTDFSTYIRGGMRAAF